MLEHILKISYASETDTLLLVFREVPVAESDETSQGIILDYDEFGKIVSLELLDASRRVEDPKLGEFIEVA